VADYKTLLDMRNTCRAVSAGTTQWGADEHTKIKWLAGQLSILAGHLADQMIPVSPQPPQPPADDDHVAKGCISFASTPPTYTGNDSLQNLWPLLADALRSMDRQAWMGRLWAIVNQAHSSGFSEGMISAQKADDEARPGDIQ
jgi:hypothetical protein